MSIASLAFAGAGAVAVLMPATSLPDAHEIMSLILAILFLYVADL
jgi:hypothetical protein